MVRPDQHLEWAPAPAECCLALANRFVTALPLLGLALVCVPAPAESPAESAVAALKRNDYRAALALLEPASGAGSADPRIWTLRGMALRGLDDAVKARESFGKALEIQPDYLPALMGAAEIDFEARSPAAEAMTRRILALRPDDPTANGMMGMILAAKDDCAAAIDHFRKSESTQGDNPAMLESLGGCLLRVRRAAEAAGVFERLLGLRPGNERAQFGLGLACHESGRPERALEILQVMAARDRPRPAVLVLTAEVLESLHRTPEALAALQKAVKLYPFEELNYISLADLCMEHGSYELGLEVLTAGERNIPGSARIRSMRGVILAQLGRHEEAEAAFAEASKLDPAEQAAAMGRSLTFQETGRLEESIRLLRQQLQESPGDGAVSYLLAQALITSGVRPSEPGFAEARKALEASLRWDPNQAEPRVALGKLLVRIGEMEEAARHFEAAARLDPTNRTATYQLMRALHKLGREQEAEDWRKRLRGQIQQGMEEDVQTNRYRLVKSGTD